uniref:Uncharacterized protein n=1 Tax=Knipowitschia caucasica TaxID=637954 RepID=A0AAV2LV90_KNICA
MWGCGVGGMGWVGMWCWGWYVWIWVREEVGLRGGMDDRQRLKEALEGVLGSYVCGGLVGLAGWGGLWVFLGCGGGSYSGGREMRGGGQGCYGFWGVDWTFFCGGGNLGFGGMWVCCLYLWNGVGWSGERGEEERNAGGAGVS